MAETSQMARSYLKNLGYKDDDITYQKGTNGGQGTINLGGKFFANGTPGADGYINLGTSALDSAMNNYKGNQLTSKTNDLIGQYEKNIMQPIQPFTYDVNQIKNDPAYQAQLNSFTQDTNRGTNQALVNLGRRGIGNSQSGVVAETAGQQNINNFANNELLPRQIAEAYSKYVDQNAAIRQQNQDILGLAGTYNDQGQQLFDNSRTNRLDDRAILESDREYDYRSDRNNILDERYKTEYDEDVRRYGIDYAHKKAMDNGQLRISQQNANTSSFNAETLRTNSQQSSDEFEYEKERDAKGVTAEEYDKYLKPALDDDGNITNKQQLEDQIILSGLSDYEQYKLYIKHRIPWTDPIPTK